MNNQKMERDPATKTRHDSAQKDVGATVSGAFSKASDLAREAADTAKQSAADGASTITNQVKEMLDRQVGSGAEVIGQLASSTKRAAEDLDERAPLVSRYGSYVREQNRRIRRRSAGPVGRWSAPPPI